MSQYLIPNYNIPILERKINKLRNKGANITFDVVDNDVQVPIAELGNNYTMSCSRVNVDGEYKINGWVFVGTIEHGSPENIIRLADYSFEGRIPERYRTAGRDCEHCHIKRDRNDTYLVYNEEHDEFKQVGRTCLKGYTRGLDADTCAEMVSLNAELDKLSSSANEGEFEIDMNDRTYSNHIHYPMETARLQALKYVQEHGYKPRETGIEFADALASNSDLPKGSVDLANEIEMWLEAPPLNDWKRNAHAAWVKKYYEPRDAGLITSAANSYIKQQQLNIRNQNSSNLSNEYAGEVGQSVEFVIADIKVAYERTGGSFYNYYSYPVYRMIGKDGKIYLWGSSNPEVEPQKGDKLKGTIKRLIERPNGEKQTELTRCKIIGKESIYRGFFNESYQPPRKTDSKYSVKSTLDRLQDLIQSELKDMIPSYYEISFELDYNKDIKNAFVLTLIDKYSRYIKDKSDLDFDFMKLNIAIHNIGGKSIVNSKKKMQITFKFNADELENSMLNDQSDSDSKFNSDFDEYERNIKSIDISKYKPSSSELAKISDYKSRNSNVNVRAIKDTDKLLRYLYGSIYLNYPDLMYQIERELINRNIMNDDFMSHNDINNIVSAIKLKVKARPFGF